MIDMLYLICFCYIFQKFILFICWIVNWFVMRVVTVGCKCVAILHDKMNRSFRLLLMIFALGWNKISNRMIFSSSKILLYQITQDFMVVLTFLLMDSFNQTQTSTLFVSQLMLLMFWIILMVFSCRMFFYSRTQMHLYMICYC